MVYAGVLRESLYRVQLRVSRAALGISVTCCEVIDLSQCPMVQFYIGGESQCIDRQQNTKLKFKETISCDRVSGISAIVADKSNMIREVSVIRHPYGHRVNLETTGNIHWNS